MSSSPSEPRPYGIVHGNHACQDARVEMYAEKVLVEVYTMVCSCGWSRRTYDRAETESRAWGHAWNDIHPYNCGHRSRWRMWVDGLRGLLTRDHR